MYPILATRFQNALQKFIRRKYDLEINVSVERPPRIEMGEAASPVCFDLGKKLKKAPRLIAQEIAVQMKPIEGIARVEVAGAGYLNAFFDRAAFLQGLQEKPERPAPSAAKGGTKIIVEHTNINPNKAAHIGHLRNAVLGDTFVRLLRLRGEPVEVQNYIDNTGVQVADVVVGYLHMEKKRAAEVRALAEQPRFDYSCWDLYTRVTHFFEEDETRLAMRNDTLQAIEEGRGEAAEIAAIVADAIVSCHLRTMARLGIGYDVLPRESEILRLKFWDAAFQKLKQTGAIYLATSGKNAGCWVMPWSDRAKQAVPNAGAETKYRLESNGAGVADETEENRQDKVIVRSNGTVTYVGKDIAYQLWKFGLLDRDFHYRRLMTAPDGRTVWVTTAEAGEPDAPRFGKAGKVFNVIDVRQAYLQEVVEAGLRALGYDDQADRSVHFSYEIVALTPRCAREMGYQLSAEDAKRPYVEVSGRKGLGVKADDLLDKLEAAARAEVDERHAGMGEEEKECTAHAIAIGALRFFLLKFTRGTIIAFDFKDALSFDGETGPYCQYAIVRVRGIRRKGLEQTQQSQTVEADAAAKLLNGAEGKEFWELVLHAGSLDSTIEAAIGAQEPAFVAKYAFQLAQTFNLFYHRHHILSEEDPQKKAFLLLLTELVERQLIVALGILGIEAPEKM
ncbi:MAG TPA: arginine--tRNA ligase [Candidatus Dormibacteraeota bacterium]|nr:arginine--tRNA ligase [Candidatus Dormibacteraeota bacterium]